MNHCYIEKYTYIFIARFVCVCVCLILTIESVLLAAVGSRLSAASGKCLLIKGFKRIKSSACFASIKILIARVGHKKSPLMLRTKTT